jgi:hypothetical protein
LLELGDLGLEDLGAASQVRVREVAHCTLLVLIPLIGCFRDFAVQFTLSTVKFLQLSPHFIILGHNLCDLLLQISVLRAILHVQSVFNHADFGLCL